MSVDTFIVSESSHPFSCKVVTWLDNSTMPIKDLSKNVNLKVNETLQKTDPEALRLLSDLCFIGGFASIAASIGIWAFKRTEDEGHAERFGIFVGLWAPTFFILSNRFERYVDRMEDSNS